MDELGHILREARETKGFTLEDVQEEIRINAKYLKSLESGDYNALPTPVHARGFLRNYARYLGLDPQPLLDRYESTLSRLPTKAAAPTNGSSSKKLPPIDFDSPVFYDPVNVEVDVGQRRDPESALRVIIVIALIIAVALVANRFVPLFMGNGDGSAAITDGINDALLNITNRAEATATAAATESQTPTADQQPIFVPGNVVTSTNRNNFDATPAPLPTRPSLPATLDEIKLRLDITERTWMEVTIDGDVVFSGWVKNGDPPYEWTATREAKVNTGNAVGVFVTINDIAWGRMGNRGENKEEIWRTTNN
ncbi:MAG: helix-turn-helix domain-containing protein [Chloroflexi bacterium]|nr:helix-turn-helix domain-containing protein [Chloroflexota bacterium]